VVAPEFAQSRHAFDRWFKDRIRAVTGVNLDEQPLGLPTRCIFDWHAEGKPVAG
jgi:hypothetical protein